MLFFLLTFHCNQDTNGSHSSRDKESDKSDDDIMEISDDESHDSYSSKIVVNKKARFDNDKLKVRVFY